MEHIICNGMNHAKLSMVKVNMKPLNINPPTKPLRPIHPQVLHSLLALAAENRPEKIPGAISRAASNILHAEVCFLISIPDDEGNITIFEGFNLATEEMIPGTVIPSSKKKLIAEKLKISQPYWNNDPEDVTIFFSTNSAKVKSTVLMCPVITSQREPIGGIILLSPITYRVWDNHDLIQLTALVDTIAHILQRVDYIATLEEKLSQSTAEKILRATRDIPSSPVNVVVPPTPEKISSIPKTKMGRIFQQSKNQPFYHIEAAMLLDEISYLSSDLENFKNKITGENGNKSPVNGGMNG
jgi:hypothetical protein